LQDSIAPAVCRIYRNASDAATKGSFGRFRMRLCGFVQRGCAIHAFVSTLDADACSGFHADFLRYRWATANSWFDVLATLHSAAA